MFRVRVPSTRMPSYHPELPFSTRDSSGRSASTFRLVDYLTFLIGKMTAAPARQAMAQIVNQTV